MKVTARPLDSEAIFRTARLMDRAREVLAYSAGVADLRPLFHGEDGVYPQFIETARGYELFDTTGQSFVDWLSGFGVVLYGYGDAEIEDAVRRQLAAGPTLSLAVEIEVEVASLLTAMIPCAESVGFGKNGSDALTAAVRLARALTQRDIVLFCGYHGFQDWYAASNRGIRGIPDALRSLIHAFAYNDLTALEQLFGHFPGRVAAVVMEPTKTHLPEPGYLEGVRELTRRHGSFLVFDEIVTGFRLANGGAQELFGVIPDLACFSKAMANGLPISAVVGPRAIMRHYPSVGVDMTFRSETVSLAAAKVVLERLSVEPAAPRLSRTGEKLRKAFDRIAENLELGCRLTGPAARMQITFDEEGDLPPAHLLGLFLDESLKHGVVTNGTVIASCAHDDEAIERSMPAFSRALEAVRSAVRAGRVHGIGSPRGPWIQGFLDEVREDANELAISGWLLCEDGAQLAVVLVSRDGERLPAAAVARPDVAQAFPYTPGASACGYRALLPLATFALEGELELVMQATRNDQIVFRCLLLYRCGTTPRSGPRCTENGAVLRL